MTQRNISFGIIGCGLMGREFASAAARWCHLLDQDVRPQIAGVCDANPAAMQWYQDNFASIKIATPDYRDLLSSPDIDAVYCAVPHNLHKQLYIDIIHAGKHLLGEKPFGIDQAANRAILAAAEARPDVLVRCSSEFPFFPGAQRVVDLVAGGQMGEIIGVEAGFLHSSDLDPNKPINWKRRVATNGEYGCMGDLGMHVLHVPLRLGLRPINVRALLSKIVRERPGKDGALEVCETWDNAVLACEAQSGGATFPMLLETKRIAPGETNTWYLRVYGTRLSAEFTTKQPKTLRTLPYTPGGPQAWHSEDLGSQSVYPTITGGIFEFGFSDSILQMWAAFCTEIAARDTGSVQDTGSMQDTGSKTFLCATPDETRQSHALFTAALESQRTAQVAAVSPRLL